MLASQLYVNCIRQEAGQSKFTSYVSAVVVAQAVEQWLSVLLGRVQFPGQPWPFLVQKCRFFLIE